MIIDYHSHIKWDRDTNQYDTAALLQDMEENQIDKRVVSALAGFSTREQNSAVAELVKANPDRIIGSAVINPKERGCVEEMERIAASGYFKNTHDGHRIFSAVAMYDAVFYSRFHLLPVNCRKSRSRLSSKRSRWIL